jgi:hypothetical protein
MRKGCIEWELHPGEELVLRFKPPPTRLMSEETREHARAARRELLLVLRGIIDDVLSRTGEQKEWKRGKGRTRIEVE